MQLGEAMEQELFYDRFVQSAKFAREFAQRYLIEELPNRFVFDLHLNASFDGNASSEFSLFPEDSNNETRLQTKRINEKSVCRWLYRDGMVPQWINFHVVGITSEATRIGIKACGRFTADEELLYHQHEGRPPFHVLGPSLPVGHQDGVKFSIFQRSVCWSIEDLDFLAQNNAAAWSLELNGPDFSDHISQALRSFETVEILELSQTKTSGKLLEAISKMPRLRIIRINGADVGEFDMGSLPSNSKSVTEFSFRGTSAKAKCGPQIRVAFPNLTKLSLAGSRNLEWDQPPTLQGLERLSLSYPELPSWVRDIAGTQSASFYFDSCDESAVFEILRSGETSLKSVGLRGTPVTNKVFEVLDSIPNLEHLDVVDTNVTKDAILDFNARRPEVSCWPKLK